MSARRPLAVLLALAGCEPTILVGPRPDDAGADAADVDAGADAGPGCATPLVATDVALGEEHGCALSGGTVRCWGSGASGQLAAGTGVATAALPFPIYSADSFLDVEAGGLLTCVRRADGTALCAGQNFGGGLADGTSQSSATLVETVPSVLDLAIGVDTVYALRAGGVFTVWGDNPYGQLGLGAAAVGTVVRTETDVAATGFAQVSAATNHACAIDAAGKLFCAGTNANHELGIPGADRDVFTAVAPATDFRSVGAGYRNSCAVTTGGALYCWGSNDPVLVVTVVGPVDQPMRVGADSDFVSVEMGFDHGCALRTGGRLFCFGDDSHGELGAPGSGVLREVTPGVGYAEVVAGRDTTCAIRASDSVVICFGSDAFGQRGRGGGAPPDPAPVCLEL